MALKYNVYLDNKIYKSGLSDKKVKIEDLKADTSYKVCVTAIDGDKESAKSCTNFRTKQEMKKPKFVAFDNDMINVTPGKPTRLVVAYDPMDLGETDIVFMTDKGIIKDGYITLSNIGDVATVNASVNGVDSQNKLVVNCVENEIELESFDIALPPKMEVGEQEIVMTKYTPETTTQRAIEVTSSEDSIAKVELVRGSWTVTALKEGSVTIEAISKYDNSKKSEYKIDIVPTTVKKFVFTPSELDLSIGGRNLVYGTSNKDISAPTSKSHTVNSKVIVDSLNDKDVLFAKLYVKCVNAVNDVKKKNRVGVSISVKLENERTTYLEKFIDNPLGNTEYMEIVMPLNLEEGMVAKNILSASLVNQVSADDVLFKGLIISNNVTDWQPAPEDFVPSTAQAGVTQLDTEFDWKNKVTVKALPENAEDKSYMLQPSEGLDVFELSDTEFLVWNNANGGKVDVVANVGDAKGSVEIDTKYSELPVDRIVVSKEEPVVEVDAPYEWCAAVTPPRIDDADCLVVENLTPDILDIVEEPRKNGITLTTTLKEDDKGMVRVSIREDNADGEKVYRDIAFTTSQTTTLLP